MLCHSNTRMLQCGYGTFACAFRLLFYMKHDIIYDNKQRIPSVIPKLPSASSETVSQDDAEGSKVYLPISGLGDPEKVAILLLNRLHLFRGLMISV